MTFEFDAAVDHVVDGDTYDVVADLGFGVSQAVRVRLLGVDTAELYGVPHDSEEYALGTEQADFVREWFATAAEEHAGDWPLEIETFQARAGLYGRYTARIHRKSDRAELTPTLIAEYPAVESEYDP